MRRSGSAVLFALLLFGGAALAAVDLNRAVEKTLVVYTTPALKDVLEQDIFPRYTAATGEHVAAVYVAAGEEFNRLRMSGAHPEADVFLHASPLFIEKGYAEDRFLPYTLPSDATIDDSLKSRNVTASGSAPGGATLRIWVAFAWSPLVEVYAPRLGAEPDLARPDVRFGLADPLLSNNGIYNAIYYETLSPASGRWALNHTVVQPVNAQAAIGGIVDGSFDVTLGYEAVSLQYRAKDANIAFGLPLLDGNRSVTPVVFVAGLAAGHPHADAERFIDFLFTPDTQAHLARYYFRPAFADAPQTAGALAWDPANVTDIAYDWSRWDALERVLPEYEVKS
ncbi:MAG: ABC transporter substrate-binding protein [Thermoplasmatota archaeon]